MNNLKLLDCTLRDGGYYNSWDFSESLIQEYLFAMASCGVNLVEIGFRSLRTQDFRGACAFTTDEFLSDLEVPPELTVAVMVNASDLLGTTTMEVVLQQLFPAVSSASPVDLVRIACHAHELSIVLPASRWLSERGYRVGFNLMQIPDRTESEVKYLAREASKFPVEVLYFADSMGSMGTADITRTCKWLRCEWKGELGIHTHDNLGLALSNILSSIDEGVTWIDGTVTGMGRGPGNARMEELAIEVANLRGLSINLVPLLSVINSYFKPMQIKNRWGTNPFYYLAGKYGIHPTFVQEMLSDSRYSSEDILSIIDYLKLGRGKKYNSSILDLARASFQNECTGSWSPLVLLRDREILLLGAGKSISNHRPAIERFVRKAKPLVIALNTQSDLDSNLIDLRVACHPVRLLADCKIHAKLTQPLVVPVSSLSSQVIGVLKDKKLFDFGLKIQPDIFEADVTRCTLPIALVFAYALAIATSGKSKRVFLAGFDGYPLDDPRWLEMQNFLRLYQTSANFCEVLSITATSYSIPVVSVYSL